jgi:hypothetical protein
LCLKWYTNIESNLMRTIRFRNNTSCAVNWIYTLYIYIYIQEWFYIKYWKVDNSLFIVDCWALACATLVILTEILFFYIHIVLKFVLFCLNNVFKCSYLNESTYHNCSLCQISEQLSCLQQVTFLTGMSQIHNTSRVSSYIKICSLHDIIWRPTIWSDSQYSGVFPRVLQFPPSIKTD